MALHCHTRGSKDSSRHSASWLGYTNGIDFEAIDDQPVDIVFLLLLPDTPNEAQLNALACVARALRDPRALERVRDATQFRAVSALGEE